MFLVSVLVLLVVLELVLGIPNILFEVTFLSKILRELFITFFPSDDFRKFTDEVSFKKRKIF